MVPLRVTEEHAAESDLRFFVVVLAKRARVSLTRSKRVLKGSKACARQSQKFRTHLGSLLLILHILQNTRREVSARVSANASEHAVCVCVCVWWCERKRSVKNSYLSHTHERERERELERERR